MGYGGREIDFCRWRGLPYGGSTRFGEGEFPPEDTLKVLPLC